MGVQLILTVWLICGVVTAIIAGSKDRNWVGWLLIGLVLGIFGVILIACMPSLSPQLVAVSSAHQQAEHRASKTCPECAETVLMEANVCKHCGFRFNSVKTISS
ncbi:zinc ribbon domain-containing protein [Rhizobium sp. HT1-10]|uniref:zinc ribbon domain-containing protein n=1 Tax=Rhizobium sp. HT1-10 TaxID=3111638 RepID=UPI003C175999